MLAPSFDQGPGPIGVAVILVDSNRLSPQTVRQAQPMMMGDPSYLENCRRMLRDEQRKAIPDLLMVTHLKRQIRRFDAPLQGVF